MRHLADQALGGSARQPRIGVERDHVTDAGRHERRTAINRDKGRVGRAAQQSIQLVQFAALAFPSDPLSFPLVPDSPPMEQEESIAFRRRSVTLIQARDPAGGGAEKLVVARRILSGGVAPVREQREAEIAVRDSPGSAPPDARPALRVPLGWSAASAPRPSCAGSPALRRQAPARESQLGRYKS